MTTAEAHSLILDHKGLAITLARRSWERCGRLVPLDDLVGEALLCLCLIVSAYDPQRGAFSTLATRSIGRRLWDFVRGYLTWSERLRPLSLLLAEPQTLPRSPTPLQRAVMGALDDLGPREQRAIVLVYFQGQTLADAARTMKLTRERVRQLLRSGEQRLGEKLLGIPLSPRADDDG